MMMKNDDDEDDAEEDGDEDDVLILLCTHLESFLSLPPPTTSLSPAGWSYRYTTGREDMECQDSRPRQTKKKPMKAYAKPV